MYRMLENLKPGSIEHQILRQFLFIENSIRPGKIAKSLSRRRSTINSALERMEQDNLVEWKKYGAVKLLRKGRRILKHLENHLHLIEIYLGKTLDLTTEEAQKQALSLAPHFSCDLIKKIYERYDEPCNCPNHTRSIYSPDSFSEEKT